MMPGQIPDPSLAAGSLPCLGPPARISATTLTDRLKLADFHRLGAMFSPLHFLGRLGKRPLSIKTEVRGKRKKRGSRADGHRDAFGCISGDRKRLARAEAPSKKMKMLQMQSPAWF